MDGLHARPPPTRRRSLRRRLQLLFTQWFALYVVIATLLVVVTVQRARQHLEQDRVLLARTIAQSADSTLDHARADLARLAADLPTDPATASELLRSHRLRERTFREALQLVDVSGRVLAGDPAQAAPPSSEGLRRAEAGPSLRVERDAAGRPTLVAIQPVPRPGARLFLVARASVFGSSLSSLLRDIAVDPGLGLYLVDGDARVVAAPDQRHLFTSIRPPETIRQRIRAKRPLVTDRAECLECGGSSGRNAPPLTVVVPLEAAPWAIVLQQSRAEAFAVIAPLRIGLVGASTVLALTGLLLSRSFSLGVIEPIRRLAKRAEGLREGRLDRPIPAEGDLEIHILGRTLDEARERLRRSLTDLRTLADELEVQVEDRTRELRSRVEDLRLLHEIASLSAREHDPAVFVPRVLEALCRRESIEAAALLYEGDDGTTRTASSPESAGTDRLFDDGPDPDGWTCWSLDHLERTEGRLAVRSTVPDPPVSTAFRLELAASLRGARLSRKTARQDSERQLLVRRLLTASEEERRRIARELHDEISQLLTLIQISLDRIGDDSEGEVRDARKWLGRTLDEVHRIVHDLRPSILDDLGLPAAVRWYAETHLAPTGLGLHIEIEDELDLDPETDIVLFRMAQEVFTNILRHAQARNVTVELYRDGPVLRLTVEDDGVGFDPGEREGGVGLVGLRERADLVGGTLKIDSAPGAGTEIRLDLPLAERRLAAHALSKESAPIDREGSPA